MAVSSYNPNCAMICGSASFPIAISCSSDMRTTCFFPVTGFRAQSVNKETVAIKQLIVMYFFILAGFCVEIFMLIICITDATILQGSACVMVDSHPGPYLLLQILQNDFLVTQDSIFNRHL